MAQYGIQCSTTKSGQGALLVTGPPGLQRVPVQPTSSGWQAAVEGDEKARRSWPAQAGEWPAW